MPFEETDTLWHGTDLASAQDIVRNGIDLWKCDRGYFGRAFYVTPDEDLAWSNYADWAEDDDPGAVVEFELIDPARTLDLRDPADWEVYQSSRLSQSLHRQDLPDIAVRAGITGVYDRSNDALAIYDPRILRVVDIHTAEDARENPPPKDYVFYTTCESADGDEINRMKAAGRMVTYETMLARCRGLLDVAVTIGYERRSTSGHGLTLKNDWHVGYYKSQYAGCPCYYFVWSGIEHIWLQAGCVPQEV